MLSAQCQTNADDGTHSPDSAAAVAAAAAKMRFGSYLPVSAGWLHSSDEKSCRNHHPHSVATRESGYGIVRELAADLRLKSNEIENPREAISAHVSAGVTEENGRCLRVTAAEAATVEEVKI